MDALACTLDCSTKTHFMQNSGKENVARFKTKKKDSIQVRDWRKGRGSPLGGLD